METKKYAYEQRILSWINSEDFRKYIDQNFELMAEIPDSFLSKLTNEKMKAIQNRAAFQFKPDILIFATSKRDKHTELIFINREISPINLRELGEIKIYSEIAKPMISFIISPNGPSNEVNLLLLRSEIQKKLLEYGDGKKIHIILLPEDKNKESTLLFPMN